VLQQEALLPILTQLIIHELDQITVDRIQFKPTIGKTKATSTHLWAMEVKLKLDQSSNQIKMEFHSTSTYQITVQTFNLHPKLEEALEICLHLLAMHLKVTN
jgi:hypothetical protein